MELRIEYDREEDGRWIAEVVSIPNVSGVMVLGATKEEATAKLKLLTLQVLADLAEHDGFELPDEPRFVA